MLNSASSKITMTIRGWNRRFIDLPIKRKIILSFMIVIGIGGVVSLVLGTRIVHQTILTLAQTKVRHDLSSAWMVVREKLNDVGDVVRLSAAREFVGTALLSGGTGEAAERLDAIRREFQLDILTLTDDSGHVVIRSRRPALRGDDQSGDPLVRRALLKQRAAGTQIISRAELLKEGSDLAERASFDFVPTPMAAERAEEREENGLVLKAAAPVLDETGAVRGVLYGGVLLSRDFELVDRIKDLVYRGEKYKDQDIGTATIFLNDLRIATNVLDARGLRAVGTRVSKEVYQSLREGRSWVGRAFVVTGWYLTAYDPVRDADGSIIGILYVGMLEKPYRDLRDRVMGTFTLLAGLCAAFLLGLLSLIAANITKPLRVMVRATDSIARGDLDHRVEIHRHDEIGQLAGSFNRMTEDLQGANEKLVHWGKTLEKLIEEKTRELREMQDAVIRSEKLASLGKIAAGVAHEINNPLTSIMIHAHLLIEQCGDRENGRESLILIADEAARCAQIVKGLLEFARMTPSEAVCADLNYIIDRVVQLLEKQAVVRNIRIVRDLDAELPSIILDRNKIQQVFSNLAINACEAMPEGGTLTVASRRSPDGAALEVRFSDTGVGIPKENLLKLFDPFFTTKSFGTGLGLAVSYGIIRRRGGTIEVHSEVGRGSVFLVRLPIEEPADESNPEEVPL